MNVLYIGPYKNTGIISIASLDIIDSLNKDARISKLTIKPIYLNDKTKETKNLVINNLENSKYAENYDCIIQHCPVDLLNTFIPYKTRNIAIPLLDKIYDKNKYLETLSLFDLVLVDSKEYFNFLTASSYDLKNVKQYSYSKLYSANQTINFHHFPNNTKMYLIGDYPLDILEKVIRSFYLAFYYRDDVSLLVFLNRPQESLHENINKMISSIKESLNMKYVIDNVNIFIKELDDHAIPAIHASANIFIDLLPSNSDSGLNRYMAESNKNKVITLEDINTYKDINKKYFSTNETIDNFSDLSLVEVLTNSLSSKSAEQESKNINTNIVDLLCQ